MGEDYKNTDLIKLLIAFLNTAVKFNKTIEISNSACIDWAIRLTSYHDFLKTDSDGYRIIDQFTDILKTPVAQRNGVMIPVEDAKIWIIEFKRLLNMLEINRF